MRKSIQDVLAKLVKIKDQVEETLDRASDAENPNEERIEGLEAEVEALETAIEALEDLE